jgi:hypothetical protein
MKAIIYPISLFLLILPRTWAVDAVSIDEFKKMNQMDREKTIEQAPAEQKGELRKIDIHISLLARWRGEEGLKIAKETQAAKFRGLGNLMMLFTVQSQVWDHYVGAIVEANGKSKMPHAAQIASVEKLFAERDAIRKRLPDIQSLIFTVAASPGALALDKRAKDLAEQWTKRMIWNGESPRSPITKEERFAMDQQADQILEEMKTLSKLTSDDAQKELDAVTDDKVRGRGYIRPLYLPPLPTGQFEERSVE